MTPQEFAQSTRSSRFAVKSLARRCLWRIPLLALLLGGGVGAAEPHPSIPAVGSLDGLGVNIHFTDPKPGEMEMIAAAGFKWVRMDFSWGATEREKGKYDFSAYDRLAAALERQKIRAYFILAYGNPLYEDGAPPRTDETRAAFGKWAAAGVKHFAGRGYLWEMWNEPNGGFWKGANKAEEYIALAKATAGALREAGLIRDSGSAGEALVGPATSEVDLPFLEACFKAGLLEDWCAVSVHPYRQGAPESVEEEYRKVRLLIRKYAPKDKKIPILSGEWGYSTAWRNFDEEKQAKYLPRQWLTNLANDIPLSIWYDWRDDGSNPSDPEHHFGIVHNEYHEGRDPVFDPKPAYQAAKTMMEQLAGMKFNKRLEFGFPGYYPLLFTKDAQMRAVFWGQSRDPLQDWIPASPGVFGARDYLGRALPEVVVKEKETPDFKIGEAPKYFEPREPNDVLRLVAAWDRLPLELVLDSAKPTTFSYSIVNPLNHDIKIGAPNAPALAPGGQRKIPMRYGPSRQERADAFLSLIVPGVCHLDQMTVLIASQPLRVVPLPVVGEILPVRLENPAGSALSGAIEVHYDDSGDSPGFGPIVGHPMRAQFKFASGQTEQTIAIPLGETPSPAYCGVVRVYEGKGTLLRRLFGLEELGRAQESVASESIWMGRLEDFGKYSAAQLAAAYAIQADGDKAASSKFVLSVAAAPEGLPGPKTNALHLTYALGSGWKFLQLKPSEEKLKLIRGVPRSFGCWVFGDAKGCVPRMRFTDSGRQVFQSSGPKIDWKGWRFITMPIRAAAGAFRGSKTRPDDTVSHWGGANDGWIDSPIQWDTLFLLDNVSREPVEGEIYLSAPTLIY